MRKFLSSTRTTSHDDFSRCLSVDLVLTYPCNATKGTVGSTQDPSSYSNVDPFRPTHISFDLAVNFAENSTYGTVTVTHSFTVLASGIHVCCSSTRALPRRVQYLAPQLAIPRRGTRTFPFTSRRPKPPNISGTP